MTKQEALAILKRNADPYLADPAELEAARGGLRCAGWLLHNLRQFRFALERYRASLSEDDGDCVLLIGKTYKSGVRTYAKALTA